MDKTVRPFEGLRVVELASVLAGPAVGMFFAELGAEVIKVENPHTNGDVTRSWKLAVEDENSSVSAYFSSVNYNKKHIFLDYTTEAGKAELNHLLSGADIVLVNFKHGKAAEFGLDYPTLREQFPELIYGNLKGFKSTPKRTAYDVVLQAEVGFMGMTGEAEGGEVKMPVALMDVLAAHQLKEGILIALLNRTQNGRGCQVEVSLEEAGLTSLYNQASNYLMTGFVPGKMGTLHPNIAPYGEVLHCKNGSLVLAVGNDKQFAHLCELLEASALIQDSRFCDNAQRVKHRSILLELLQGAAKNEERDVLLQRCIDQGVPVGAIRKLNEVLDQPVAQGLVRKEVVDGVQTKRLSTVAFKLSD